ncbi:SEL1-like repeat protein [Xinfangfangia sp. D13-10-4-6]|uniref:SEL1-like repeat protein n=1 Tax=Pseudogemmobacter hezensis TaxID=2737662 RepID=UPI0015578F62|nr:SEL1-like repeat protein [Pseudogemmobacter hezensis]NPD17710.1 SEL1-like repeat protein [Pseudogemmobacter hezensis]
MTPEKRQPRGFTFPAAALLATVVWAQPSQAETVPDFQPAGMRQVCAATAVYDAPGGRQIGQLDPGEVIERTALRFDTAGRLFYGFAYEGGEAVADAAELPRSCEFAQRETIAPVFAAPPNSCHLIVAARRELDEVNAVTASYPDFWPQISVYLSDNGWHAVSLGLVRRDMAELVLAAGEGLPGDAYCSDGARFLAALEPEGAGRFGAGQLRGQSAPDQAAAAQALLVQWENGAGTTPLRQACLLGSSVSCNRYAWELRDASETSAEAAAERLRYDLYGCMLGEEHSCTNAVFVPRSEGPDPILALLPEWQRPAEDTGLIFPDLAATACDRNVIPACHALARPYLGRQGLSAEDYLTLLEGTARACMAGGDCQPFSAAVAEHAPVLGKSWPAIDQMGIGRLLFPYCSTDSAAWGCALSVKYLKTYVENAAGDPGRATEAAALIGEACGLGSPDACAYQSGFTAQFDPATRDAAAEKAKAICAAQPDPTELCDSLARRLATDLPASAGPLQAEYQRLAAICRETRATESGNPCAGAFEFYLANISHENPEAPLALLAETCSPGGKITGCDPLGRFHAGQSYRLDDGSDYRPAPALEKARSAWEIGCDGSTEGIASCSALGRSLEQAKDHVAAGLAFGTGCDAAHRAQPAPARDPSGICYDAAKNARNALQDYARAAPYFDAACNRFDEPFACKFLGLMHAQGEGMEPDPVAARDLYQRACFYRVEVLRDEQACMLFGQLLVADHAALAQPGPDETEAEASAYAAELLTHASLGLQIGCKGGYQGGYQAACEDARSLLKRWSEGAYPTEPVTCTTIGNDGVMRAPQTCRAFWFYLTEELGGHGPDYAASVYVWPDGQRTITLETSDAFYLNDNPARLDHSQTGWTCYKNQSTGRSFCVQS